MVIIARYHCALEGKFGAPRQSGLAPALRGTVVFTPPYRVPEALRGIEGFSHLWLLWGFSENPVRDWSPTVRPPRLGGNVRVGVFASRSPNRPNPIGLSCVELLEVRADPVLGSVLEVAGADLIDNTPVYDIKPYLPYADAHPDALGGYAGEEPERLTVIFSPDAEQNFTREEQDTLRDILAQDPRPAYHHDRDRIYALRFAGRDVRFQVRGGVVIVVE